MDAKFHSVWLSLEIVHLRVDMSKGIRLCPCIWVTIAGFISLVHYTDVIMTMIASQITSLTIVYSIVRSGADQRKHQSSASVAFVRGIHRDRWFPRTRPVPPKMFPIDDVIMWQE